jgi:hypothetical protein
LEVHAAWPSPLLRARSGIHPAGQAACGRTVEQPGLPKPERCLTSLPAAMAPVPTVHGSGTGSRPCQEQQETPRAATGTGKGHCTGWGGVGRHRMPRRRAAQRKSDAAPTVAGGRPKAAAAAGPRRRPPRTGHGAAWPRSPWLGPWLSLGAAEQQPSHCHS